MTLRTSVLVTLILWLIVRLRSRLAPGRGTWASALKHIQTATAAVAQLSVPVITAVAGVALLAEPVSLRLVLAGTGVLGGIALVVVRRNPGIESRER